MLAKEALAVCFPFARVLVFAVDEEWIFLFTPHVAPFELIFTLLGASKRLHQHRSPSIYPLRPEEN